MKTVPAFFATLTWPWCTRSACAPSTAMASAPAGKGGSALCSDAEVLPCSRAAAVKCCGAHFCLRHLAATPHAAHTSLWTVVDATVFHTQQADAAALRERAAEALAGDIAVVERLKAAADAEAAARRAAKAAPAAALAASSSGGTAAAAAAGKPLAAPTFASLQARLGAGRTTGGESGSRSGGLPPPPPQAADSSSDSEDGAAAAAGGNGQRLYARDYDRDRPPPFAGWGRAADAGSAGSGQAVATEAGEAAAAAAAQAAASPPRPAGSPSRTAQQQPPLPRAAMIDILDDGLGGAGPAFALPPVRAAIVKMLASALHAGCTADATAATAARRVASSATGSGAGLIASLAAAEAARGGTSATHVPSAKALGTLAASLEAALFAKLGKVPSDGGAGGEEAASSGGAAAAAAPAAASYSTAAAAAAPPVPTPAAPTTAATPAASSDPGKDYRDTARELALALRSSKNADFRGRVVGGELAPTLLVEAGKATWASADSLARRAALQAVLNVDGHTTSMGPGGASMLGAGLAAEEAAWAAAGRPCRVCGSRDTQYVLLGAGLQAQHRADSRKSEVWGSGSLFTEEEELMQRLRCLACGEEWTAPFL